MIETESRQPEFRREKGAAGGEWWCLAWSRTRMVRFGIGRAEPWKLTCFLLWLGKMSLLLLCWFCLPWFPATKNQRCFTDLDDVTDHLAGSLRSRKCQNNKSPGKGATDLQKTRVTPRWLKLKKAPGYVFHWFFEGYRFEKDGCIKKMLNRLYPTWMILLRFSDSRNCNGLGWGFLGC